MLSEAEKKQIYDLKAQGYTSDQIKGFIGGKRLGRDSTISRAQLTEKETSFSLSPETQGDIQEMGQGFVGAFGADRERQAQIQQLRASGQQGSLSSTLQSLGSTGTAVAEAAGEIGLGIGKLFLTQQQEEATAQQVQGAVSEIVRRSMAGEQVPSAISTYQNLSPEAQRNIRAILGIAEGVGTATGILGAFSKAKSLIPKRVKGEPTISAPSEPTIKVAETPYAPFGGTMGDFITNARIQLSDVDPRVRTVLENQQNADKVNAYFSQAEKAALDPSIPMATQLAAQNAENAYRAIGDMKNLVGEAKREALGVIANDRVPNNVPGRAIDSVKAGISERFGVEIDQFGNITQTAGRMATIDQQSQKLIGQYVTMLRQLGPNPTAQQLDDFVDAAQNMLYKQSSPNLFEIADEPVIAFLKQETGKVNGELKTAVDEALKAKGIDPIYATFNERWQLLNDIEGRLSKRLGTEGDKGASLMKSLFSPQTGEPTRRLFEQIKNETGIDLFEDATLAKFAMESVGDTRSKSLLQSLDEGARDVAQLDLTKPGTWYNFLRERADLDGKSLANAIIEQTKKNPALVGSVGAGSAYYLTADEDTSMTPLIAIAGITVGAGATRKEVANRLAKNLDDATVGELQDFSTVIKDKLVISGKDGNLTFKASDTMTEDEVKNAFMAGLRFVEYDGDVTALLEQKRPGDIAKFYDEVIEEFETK